MKRWWRCLALILSLVGSLTTTVAASEKVELILDWVPNTNHSGLYMALEKGYFKEIGVEVEIRRPPEGSTTELVGLGKAQLGISFQDSLAHRFVGGLPVKAVAAIVEHNTSGIIATQASGVKSPRDLEGKRYGTWNDPTELAMLNYIVEDAQGNSKKVELVPNQEDNSLVGLANDQFDAAWIYYGWDGIMAEHQGLETKFLPLKDYGDALDYYSPVLIANNTYLKENKDQARAVIQAIKKGYQAAASHPEEAVKVLIKHAPELKDQEDFLLKSQRWMSNQYAKNMERWGHIDGERWDDFYQWLVEQNLVDPSLLEGSYFTNEFID